MRYALVGGRATGKGHTSVNITGFETCEGGAKALREQGKPVEMLKAKGVNIIVKPCKVVHPGVQCG